uniref:CACTA en-spm transposon protein n=1 Tax=Cucumis melo TaxID=3656 RepID=A0A9I9E6Q9_CUCME
MSVGNSPFPDAFFGDFPMPRHCIGKSPFKSFQFCNLQNRNREGKREEKPRASSPFPSPFRRRSSQLFLADVCHFRLCWLSCSYGSLCSFEGFVGCEDILKYFVRVIKEFRADCQMLTTFKEFRADCHRHFKKYSDPEEARANPPNALEQSRTNKAARQKQPYNHSSGSKSFLERQYELAERRGQPVDRVELFRETHIRAGTFVSQAAEDAHNQMLELQSQHTLEGSQPLSEDEICDQVLGRRPGYSKGLGWGSKPKARRTASASSSSTSCSQSTEKEIELQAKLHEALERIEVQDRNHQALASQVESMKKMIEELTRAQQGPPHDL